MTGLANWLSNSRYARAGCSRASSLGPPSRKRCAASPAESPDGSRESARVTSDRSGTDEDTSQMWQRSCRAIPLAVLHAEGRTEPEFPAIVRVFTGAEGEGQHRGHRRVNPVALPPGTQCATLDEEPRLKRPSNHVAPHGPIGIARHYIGDLVYGANDGLVTTFAAVAGVEGAALSPVTVLIVGFANLAADGLSMGIGNYLSIRAREHAREADNLAEDESQPARHGIATFLAFVIAGAIPLLPYMVGVPNPLRGWSSAAITSATLFSVGAARGLVTNRKWWRTGLEVLALGALAGAVAFAAGALVARAMRASTLR